MNQSVFEKRSLKDIYEEIRQVYLSDNRPWILGFSGGKDSTESGVSGMTVITVNVADFADVNKTTTNENGDYSFELDIGTYLVQVESTPSFAYISVIDGSIVVQNLGI